MAENHKKDSENVIIGEIQMLLAQKRTSLAAMRTGIAVFALPLSVLSVLIATSRYYDVIHVIHLLVPLLLICIALLILGGYLIIRAIVKMHRYDRLMLSIKQKHGKLAEFID